MTNRADIRNRVRIELNDTAVGNYLYSDALLNSYFDEAVRDWSSKKPPMKYVTIVAVGAATQYTIAGEVQRIVSVEQPKGVIMPQGNTSYADSGLGQCWDWDSRPTGAFFQMLTLRFASKTGEADLLVGYYGYYLSPVNDTDVLDVQASDEGALVWFVCGRALQWLETQREKRGDKSNLPRARIYETRYKQYVTRASQQQGVGSGQLGDRG